MSDITLKTLLESFHEVVEHDLTISRKSHAHPVSKGDATENVWIKLFKDYLPKRYSVDKAFIVDSNGSFSQQMDVVIYDRQYTPFIFVHQEQKYVPAEAVYAVFEAKQDIKGQVNYAQEKIGSVRSLHRTNMPVPHAGGEFEPRPLQPIVGGLLTLESSWSPALGKTLLSALGDDTDIGIIDIGCVAAHGYFSFSAGDGKYEVFDAGKPATAFVFRLISILQARATVPMIDIQAYARWIDG